MHSSIRQARKHVICVIVRRSLGSKLLRSEKELCHSLTDYAITFFFVLRTSFVVCLGDHVYNCDRLGRYGSGYGILHYIDRVCRRTTAQRSDKRISVMSEILNGIKVR